MNHFTKRLGEIVAEIKAAAKAKPKPPPVELAGLPEPPPRNLCETLFPHLWAQDAIRHARKRAKAKGLECHISEKWLLARLERIGYCCELSGIEFSGARPRDSHKRPWMPSVDRKDCTKGYTPENVRIVCVAVNTLLQDWGDDVFFVIRGAKQ